LGRPMAFENLFPARTGNDQTSDDLMPLIRYAVPQDQAAVDAWFANVNANVKVYKVSKSTGVSRYPWVDELRCAQTPSLNTGHDPGIVGHDPESSNHPRPSVSVTIPGMTGHDRPEYPLDAAAADDQRSDADAAGDRDPLRARDVVPLSSAPPADPPR
jgi:hypothetical protein